MFENYAEILRLIDFAGGSVAGRKKLQKLVYLAQQRGLPFTETFKYHLYGPFSEQLANEIEEMKAYGFVSEEKQTSHRSPFCCSLTLEGRNLMAKYVTPTDHCVSKDLISALSQRDARELELVATVLFLLKCQYDEEETIGTIKTLKPERNYLDNEVLEAQAFLKNHGFLKEDA